MKITLYYDDTCTLCTTNAIEMQAKNSKEISIISVDAGLAELNKAGISREQAMTYVCIKDSSEQIHQGMQAISLLCKVADIPHRWLLHLPIIKQLSDISYPFVARNRYYFPRWAIRLLYGTVVEANTSNSASNDANADGNQCENGVCHIPPNKR